jgi:rubredoxin
MDMDKYMCRLCSYVYDPEKGDPSHGVPSKTPFDKLSEDNSSWVCPDCGAATEFFFKLMR